MPPPEIVLSCEHAGNFLPPEYRIFFLGWKELASTHRAYDPGALDLAERLAGLLRAPLFQAEATRLLVDVNRSLGHPNLFSTFSRGLSRQDRQDVLDRFYHPYRDAVSRAIATCLSRGKQVLHLAVHTFTPVLGKSIRPMDIGLLYDPAREREKQMCASWRTALIRHTPGIKVRRNAPYRGRADGLTTALRRRFSRSYLGIELEVNQRHFTGGFNQSESFASMLDQTLREILPSLDSA